MRKNQNALDHSSLVYVSSATKLLENEELEDILAASRRNNEALGVTGLLLYVSGNFLQLLEGPCNSVKSLFETIQRDRRHRSVIVVDESVREQRLFPDWKMGFRNLNNDEIINNPGFSSILLSVGPLEDAHLQRSELLDLINQFRQMR